VCLDRDGQLPLVPWVGAAAGTGATSGAPTYARPAFSVSYPDLRLTDPAAVCSSGERAVYPHPFHRFTSPHRLRPFLSSLTTDGAGTVSAADIPVGKVYIPALIRAGGVSGAALHVVKPRACGTTSLTQGQLARSPPAAFP
jgi:hypothetical protein